MNISITVMAHPRRAFEAIELANNLGKMPFSRIKVIYDRFDNEWDTGRRCWLEHGTQSDFSVVIQDDAIIDKYFYTNLLNAINAMPQHTLMSMYTGKIRPFPTRIKNAVNNAEHHQASWLSYSELLWGVCVGMPTVLILHVIAEADKHPKKLYDRKLGQYFKRTRQPIYYTHPSLVDHNDSLDSLTGHKRINQAPRVAHNYSGEAIQFNSKVITINPS